MCSWTLFALIRTSNGLPLNVYACTLHSDLFGRPFCSTMKGLSTNGWIGGLDLCHELPANRRLMELIDANVKWPCIEPS